MRRGILAALCGAATLVLWMSAAGAVGAGNIDTYAGTGTAGYTGDGGPATAANINPWGLAVDPSGHLYIADRTNHVIRRIDASTQVITTVAGTGTAGYSGNGGAATSAQINGPWDLVFDAAGNMYIADNLNDRIRKVDTGGTITDFATVPGPRGLAIDASGNLYTATDTGIYPNRLIKISSGGVVTIHAGINACCFAGDGGPATSARLQDPVWAAADSAGNSWVIGTHRVRKVDTGGIINTVAGGGGSQADGIAGTSAVLQNPYGTVVDDVGNLFIAVINDDIVRKLDTSGIITTVAGTLDANGFGGDGGPATSASMNGVSDVAIDPNGNLFIADTANARVRVVGSLAQVDADGDGVFAPNDNCSTVVNAGQENNDGDSEGDACDADDDNDGTPDTSDAFPFDASETADSDGDGIGDNSDNCPGIGNAAQTDLDGDGDGDPCDDDNDGDGVPDSADAFPNDRSESQDSDGDGVGDNADPDDDNDGVDDEEDAFPLDASETTDSDGDGQGDNADPDDDNDGVPDEQDAFPLDGTESADFDGDGIGDNADPDDDNDGVPDDQDAFPNDPDATGDSDGDGVPDEQDAFPSDPTRSENPAESATAFDEFSFTLEQLRLGGLPASTGMPIRLTITDMEPGTKLTLTGSGIVLRATAGPDGTASLFVPVEMDLSEATLAAEEPDGETTTVSSEDELTLGDSTLDLQFSFAAGGSVSGSSVNVNGTGLAPNSLVDVFVLSDPVHIGSTTTDANGDFAAALPLPAGLERGDHRVVVAGTGPEGPVSGTWFFTMNGEDEVVHIGDPGAEADAALAADEAAAVDEEEPVDEETEPVVIDDETGLPVYDPASSAHAQETADLTVEAIALLSLLGVGGSAMSMASMASSAGTAGTAGTMPGSSSGGGTAGSARERKGRAKAKAKKLGRMGENEGIGDASVTWRWPGTGFTDQVSLNGPLALGPFSPFLSRVLIDGSWLRAIFGSLPVVLPLAGIYFGIEAAEQVGGTTTAPTFVLYTGILLLGIADAMTGLAAAIVFIVGTSLQGAVGSIDDLWALVAIASPWFAVPTIANRLRPYRRPRPETSVDWWNRLADVVIGASLAAWAAQKVLEALPGLVGLDLPISQRATDFGLIAFGALVLRYAGETAASFWYPQRLLAVTAERVPKPGKGQTLISLSLMAFFIMFVAWPFVGGVWQLYVATALLVGSRALIIVPIEFPNYPKLYRALPQGVPKMLILMILGFALTSLMASLIDDPQQFVATVLMVVAIPVAVHGTLSQFAKKGSAVLPDWPGRFAGVNVVLVTGAMMVGLLADRWWLAALLALPALAWWVPKFEETPATSDSGPNGSG